jgi:hypothetical protein
LSTVSHSLRSERFNDGESLNGVRACSGGIVGCRGDQFTRLMLKLAAGSSAAIAATGSGGRHLNCLTSTRSG